jgi:peptidoglycan/LPS O-acetylase OafA/YrhL
MTSTEDKRHFHTLDALRFFAFFKVFLLHVPITHSAVFSYIRVGGDIAVQFFFVLSGFLITYIITEEKARSGRFDLKKFYIRRILRIWPLYYLLLGFVFVKPYVLSFLNIPFTDEGYDFNYLYPLAFLENYRQIFIHEGAYVSPMGVLWSVCVEEHFYIVWGFILYVVEARHLPKIFCASLVLSLASRSIFIHQGFGTYDLLTNLDLFAFGSILAYLLAEYGDVLERRINKISSPMKAGYIVFVLAFVTILPHLREKVGSNLLQILSPTILGLMFCILLAIFLPVDSRFRLGDRNIFSRLGKYTYGLYLYHTVVINLVNQIFQKSGIGLDDSASACVYFLISLALSVLVSVLSYLFFEKHFLKLKKYFY